MVTNMDKAADNALGATMDLSADKLEELIKTADADSEENDKTVAELSEEKSTAAPTPSKASVPTDAGAPNIPGYTILRKLGEGGMGAVFHAKQTSMDREVALKILPARFASNEQFVERFYREARSCAKLDHPNVVRGYDVGEANGIHYFAMEFVDGASAQSYLDNQKKLDAGDAVKIVYDVACALVQAADHKMVHRDIKPDNIMITKKGIVKLADLGLAKQMDDDSGLTSTGSGFGTPYYMPPEQARNAKHVDARSDIYALGATLYHLITGEVPFKGTTAMEVLVEKEKGKFKPPSAIVPDSPRQLNLVIDKMMSKDPKLRYQTAAELVKAFDDLDLHHAALSFIAGAVSAPKAAAGAATKAAHATTPQTKAGDKQTSKIDTNTWYLRYKDPTGKEIKTKATTDVVKDRIHKKMLNDLVEASHSPKGPFKRLQAYPEFENLLRSKIAARTVAKKENIATNKMHDLLNNFDAEQAKIRRKKKMKSFLMLVWSLLLTIVIFGGGGFLLYQFALKPAAKGVKEASENLEKEIMQNKKMRNG